MNEKKQIDNILLVMPEIPSWKVGARELVRAFFPNASIQINKDTDDEKDILILKISLQSDILVMTAKRFGKKIQKKLYEDIKKPIVSKKFKGFFYRFLSELTKRSLPWGCLTGIKPVKMVQEILADNGEDWEQAKQSFQRAFYVSKEKTDLAFNIAKVEAPFIHVKERNKVSVYIGIPICPAKCTYCSFVSTIADKKGKLCSEYMNILINEINRFSLFIQEHQLIIDTLYIGGGTPSVLTAEQIQQLLETLTEKFDLSNLREFTFEAGRPETTTLEKLEMLHHYHVNRICLNPQSMNDSTLQAVGRLHSADDIRKKFAMIKKVGFESVNMDLIVGLNDETPEMFFSSLEQVIALHPENLTVHSLAIKKGSRLREQRGCGLHQLYSKEFYDEISQRLACSGYHPYYLYRQKYAQGNGENIGYCLNGKEGIYNILMMAEKQTIIGIGAGATGKIYHSENNRFDKVYTVKDLRTYNQRAEEVIDKKLKAYSQYIKVC
jgi:oxygen-independent coproporphyrinogen-3 oxidase